MAKAVQVNFDDNSQSILKEVDAIHRDSLINMGLALVSRTEYYKTLTGKINDDVSKVASLSSLDELEKELNEEPVKPKTANAPTSSDWDDF